MPKIKNLKPRQIYFSQMKQNFIFPIILLLCFSACNSSETAEELKNSLASGIAPVLAPDKTDFEIDMLRPFSYNFEGILAEQNVELFLSYDPRKQQEACIPVEGDYIALGTSHTKLEGELCLDKESISLKSEKTDRTALTINGKADATMSSVQGEWKDGNNAGKVFELKNKNQKLPAEALKLFADKLQDHFNNHPLFVMDNIGIDEQGIFIKGFQSKGVTLEHFSSSNLKWSYWKESEMGSRDIIELLDLWSYNNKDFVIVIRTVDWEEKIDEDGVPKESENINIEVWKYENNNFHNIFVPEPDKVDLSQVNWYAIAQNGVLQLHQNRPDMSWDWEH